MVEFAVKKNRFTKEETLIVGDRLYTDILCGKRAGVETALVLTGEASREEAQRSDNPPEYIFSSIEELFHVWADESAANI